MCGSYAIRGKDLRGCVIVVWIDPDGGIDVLLVDVKRKQIPVSLDIDLVELSELLFRPP